jgi:hypothetical protein
MLSVLNQWLDTARLTLPVPKPDWVSPAKRFQNLIIARPNQMQELNLQIIDIFENRLQISLNLISVARAYHTEVSLFPAFQVQEQR